MHDDDSLHLGPLGFLDEPVHVAGIAAQQHDGTFQVKSGGGDDRVDGTAMTRKAGGPEQLAGPAGDGGRHGHDGDPGQHTVRGSVTGAASTSGGKPA